jgi:hypothetical protein
MAENLAVQFFIDAKGQYASALKWRWIVLALIAYLHVGLVLPFASDVREQTKLGTEIADSRATQDALKPILAAADAFAKRLDDAKKKAVAALTDDLAGGFRQLSEKVNGLAELGPAKAEGDEGEAIFVSPRPPMQPLMAQQAVRQDPPTVAPMEAKLRRQIAEGAKRPGDIPSDLQAYIDAHIVAPAFARANAAWGGGGKQIAQEMAAKIAESIASTRTSAPAATTELDRLEKAARALRDGAQNLTFKPPPNDTWWRTVNDKEATVLSMTAGLSSSVSAFTTSQVALQTLSAHIEEIATQNQSAANQLNDALKELETRAAALQAQIGEVGAPLKVISFKLAQIAPLMPLVIAIALAALAAWTADGLRRMTLSAQLVADADAAKAIRVWLRAAAGGSRPQLVATETALAIAALAWVIAAALNVESLPPPILTQPILAAIAVIIILGARAYHWRCADEALSAA